MPNRIDTDTLGPASVDDAWAAVGRDGSYHLFPAAGGGCLCGMHMMSERGGGIERRRSGGITLRPFCATCRDLQLARWGLVEVAPPSHPHAAS